jgi:uncharacterized protein YdcH (DUF465 family)
MPDAQLPMGDDVKSVLLRTDESFRQLVSEHQALDERIRHLSHQSFPTDQEQIEEVALKKRKLALKDRIEATLRQMDGHRTASAGGR